MLLNLLREQQFCNLSTVIEQNQFIEQISLTFHCYRNFILFIGVLVQIFNLNPEHEWSSVTAPQRADFQRASVLVQITSEVSATFEYFTDF